MPWQGERGWSFLERNAENEIRGHITTTSCWLANGKIWFRERAGVTFTRMCLLGNGYDFRARQSGVQDIRTWTFITLSGAKWPEGAANWWGADSEYALRGSLWESGWMQHWCLCNVLYWGLVAVADTMIISSFWIDCPRLWKIQCLPGEISYGGTDHSWIKIENLFLLRLKAAHDVACAIEYMHSRTIINRDLKTSNVAGFDVRGDLKLFDFGLSWLLPPQSEEVECGYIHHVESWYKVL